MAEHDNEELARRFYEEFWTRGRTVEAGGIDLLRFSDGLIAEWIYSEDTLGVFAQLGALPADLSGLAGPDHAG